MSIPTGSKTITNIDVNNYNYLISQTQIETDWATAKQYYEGKGKPSTNLLSDIVTVEDYELIQSKLPEKQKDYIFTDNNIYTGSNVLSDFDFTTTPNEEYIVKITFVDEGAGYKNALGYYFYHTDVNDDEFILDNSNTNTDNSSGYYRPTIIFPNASSKFGGSLRSDGVLLPGDQRILKGNLSNGKFKNVKVGFFVVPNGWDNKDVSTSVGVRYNNKEIIHTTSKLNSNHVDNAIGVDNHGYQTILFNYNLGQEYILSFEDIKRPWGDGDFNDLTVRIKTEPIIDIDDAATIDGLSVDSNFLQKTLQGLLFVAPTSTFTNIGNNNISYRFARTLNFDSEVFKNLYKDLYDNNYINFAQGITVTLDDIDTDTLKISYNFTNTIINDNVVNDNTQIYLLNKYENNDDDVVIDADNPDLTDITNFDKLVKMQRLENDNVLNENFELFEINETTSGIDNTLASVTNTVPRNILGSASVWGDPHIRTISGKILTMAKDVGMFNYLNTDKLKVDILLDFFTEHPIPVYREFTYIKKVFFTDKKVNMTAEVDMFDPKLNHINPSSCFELLNHNDILKDKKLRRKYLSLVSFDRDTYAKIIKWKNIHVWIIFYPNKSEYLNEIYIDKHELNKFVDHNSSGLICG